MKSGVSEVPVDQKAAKAIADRGEKIYAENIKPHIDIEKEKGKFVVIDVDTGDYEIDRRDAAATRRLVDRHPDAVTYAVRIGRPTAYRMGGLRIERNLP
jgi:hypothetical protein